MNRPIAADTETHRIKPGLSTPKLVCTSVATPSKETALYTGPQATDSLHELIKNELTTFHHAFFDLGILAAERPKALPDIFQALDEGRIHCTKIRQQIIDNAQGKLKFDYNPETYEYKKQRYDLAWLMYRHFKRNIFAKKQGDDVWRLRYHELDGVPLSSWPEDAKAYAIDDSVDDLALWDSQQKDIHPLTNPPGFESEMQAAWALNLMSTWGFRTDEKAVREYKKELEKEFAEHVRTCQEFGFRRNTKKKRTGELVISRDMKKIRAAIEKWYKAHPECRMKLTEKGAIATDREQLTDTDHPGLNAVAESVRTEKLLTTYIPALERGFHVPLNPNYNPIIETFRTSCSGGMKIDKVPVGINVQNLPSKGKIRPCVIPRDGFVFAFCDYDTLEMRTLAQVCIILFGYSHIAQAIKEGQDLHVALGADILDLPYRDLFARYEAGESQADEIRRLAKLTNYGLGGGMGATTLIKYAKAFGVTLDLPTAKKLYGGFRRKWREMVEYFAYCSALCSVNSDEEGRAERVEFIGSGMMRGKVPYTAVCNGFFQHLAAKGAKAALYQATKECYIDAGSPLHGCRPWLFAHDEIGIEIPYAAFGPKRSHEAAMRLQEVMIEEMEKWCPDVPIGATVAMTRRWHKGARPIKRNGILVPVKPEGKKWVPDV